MKQLLLSLLNSKEYYSSNLLRGVFKKTEPHITDPEVIETFIIRRFLQYEGSFGSFDVDFYDQLELYKSIIEEREQITDEMANIIIKIAKSMNHRRHANYEELFYEIHRKLNPAILGSLKMI